MHVGVNVNRLRGSVTEGKEQVEPCAHRGCQQGSVACCPSVVMLHVLTVHQAFNCVLTPVTVYRCVDGRQMDRQTHVEAGHHLCCQVAIAELSAWVLDGRAEVQALCSRTRTRFCGAAGQAQGFVGHMDRAR